MRAKADGPSRLELPDAEMVAVLAAKTAPTNTFHDCTAVLKITLDLDRAYIAS